MTMLELATHERSLPLFVSRPDEPATAAMIIVQEAYGLTDHIKDVTGRAAAAGYLAVAPALFHRVGSAVVDYGDWDSAKALIDTLTDEGLTADVDSTLG